MAKNKTQETDASVDSYLAAIEDEARRNDCEALAKLMARATKRPPKMWGSSIVGFGSYHYKRAVARGTSVWWALRLARAISASMA